jgi:hypothetical protein
MKSTTEAAEFWNLAGENTKHINHIISCGNKRIFS